MNCDKKGGDFVPKVPKIGQKRLFYPNLFLSVPIIWRLEEKLVSLHRQTKLYAL